MFTRCKLQLLYALKPAFNYWKSYGLVIDILNESELDFNFLSIILFNDESTFHIFGHIHCHQLYLVMIKNVWFGEINLEL